MKLTIPFFESLLSQNFLSIDFGSMNIKIVEGLKKENSLEIAHFGIIPIVSFKEISLSSYILEENLASLIKEFLKTAKAKANHVIFNVPTPYVFATSFLVPYIPEKSLPQVVRFESQKQIPLSLEEIEIEFRYIEIQPENQAKQWLVFLAAVPKSYLQKLENVASLIKLKFSGYGIEYFNLEPYFWGRTGNFVVFDLGHSYSTLHLIKNGVTIYGNKLKIRGYDYLDSIMKITQYSEEEVLSLISKRGFLFNPEEKELKYLAENFLNNLSGMIQAEIEKLENNFLLKIDKIYWSGGIPLIPGFKEGVLHRLSQYQQEILLPSEIVKGDKFKLLKEKSAIFSQPVGLLFRKLLR